MSENSSDDEAAETPIQPCPALEAAPRAKGVQPTKVAPNKKKRRAAEEKEESDNVFAPKKGNEKGGKDTETISGNTNKKPAASIAKAKTPSQRSQQVKSITTYIHTCIHTKYIHTYKIFERLVYISRFVNSLFGVQNTPSKGAQSESASKNKPKQHPAPAPSTSTTMSRI